LDEKARDVIVRLEFTNPDLEMKPGMYSNVWIKTPAIEDVIVVPTEAVIRSGHRNVVFVTRGEGRFEPREVLIGEESDDGKLRIISGLQENDEVVISAQFLIDSESRLQEAIQKMLQEKAGGSN
jgi:Cu(I)/Ag(I) efflux system membrane fusion protein/cobalt-zinc-cadmium efflux system membrane fusion protein